jgi:UPF0755 protein
MSKKKRKKRLVILVALALIAAGLWFLKTKFLPQVKLKDKNHVFIYVEPQDLIEDISEKLHEEGVIDDPAAFEWLAERMHLSEEIHPGKYRIINGMNMRQVVNLLRYGKEEKITLSLNWQIRDLEEFIEYVDDKLLLSDEEMEHFFSDEARLQELFGLSSFNAFAAIVPGSVKVSWAISADSLVALLSQRYWKVYTPARVAKAKKLGYDLNELQVIASIVQSESGIASEQKKIAGVYINRLKKNMPLQADPTLKYARRSFHLQRVLNVDKEIESPYNTYMHKGLPPGPICLVNTQAIDATLNYTRHKYLYFCARPDLNGYSDFSTTYQEHRRNATVYRKSLDRRGITR